MAFERQEFEILSALVSMAQAFFPIALSFTEPTLGLGNFLRACLSKTWLLGTRQKRRGRKECVKD